MAEYNGLIKEQLSQNLMDLQEIKLQFEERVNWSVAEWKLNGKADSRMHFFIKSCRFWFINLKEATLDNVMVFTLYSESLNKRMDIKTIMQCFKKQVGLKGLIGYSLTRNKIFVSLEFSSAELKNNVMETFQHVNDMPNWFKEQDEFDVSCPHLLLDVHNILSPFLNITNIHKEILEIDDEDKLPSGTILAKAKLQPNIKMDTVPHLMEVHGYQALLIINKRQPLCLNCYALGHISRNCELVYCKTCRTKKLKGHVCGQTNNDSYANMLKRNIAIQEDWKKILKKQAGEVNALVTKVSDNKGIINKGEGEKMNKQKEEEKVMQQDQHETIIQVLEQETMDFQTRQNKRRFKDLVQNDKDNATKDKITYSRVPGSNPA